MPFGTCPIPVSRVTFHDNAGNNFAYFDFEGVEPK
jgi:hypothetical protein